MKAVGSDPDALPPERIAAALPLVPVLRRGRLAWESELPLAELASAMFPKLVVSGGHSAGFDAICDDLAERIGASRAEWRARQGQKCAAGNEAEKWLVKLAGRNFGLMARDSHLESMRR